MLRASFALSYALVFLSLHGANDATPQVAVEHYQGSIYSLYSLGIPSALRDRLIVGVLVAQVAATLAWIGLIARSGALGAGGPAIAVLVLQAVWFSLPACVVVFEGLATIDPFAPGQRAYAFMWIAIGHFVQYLWITAYSAARSGGGRGGGSSLRYLGRALLVGISLWSLPALLFAPGLLGSLPYDLGLGLLAASVVNLHHFVLDGVIWRLRDGRVASRLLDPLGARTSDSASASLRERAGRPARGAQAAGAAIAVCVLGLSLFASFESMIGNRAADRGDFERYALSVERRAWLGRDGPEPRFLLGVQALQASELGRAWGEVERGLALHPTADLRRLEGELAGLEGDAERALAAYQAAVTLDPGSAPALFQVGRLLAEQGRVGEAIEMLERAERVWPDMPEIRSLLQTLRARANGEEPQRDGPWFSRH